MAVKFLLLSFVELEKSILTTYIFLIITEYCTAMKSAMLVKKRRGGGWSF